MTVIKKLKYGNNDTYTFNDVFLTLTNTDDRYYRENEHSYPPHQLFPNTYKNYKFILDDPYPFVPYVYDFSNVKSSDIFEIYENNNTLEINPNYIQNNKIYLLDSGNGSVYIFYIAAQRNIDDGMGEMAQPSSNYPGKTLLGLAYGYASDNPFFPLKTNIYFENFSKDQHLTHACPVHFINCKIHLKYWEDGAIEHNIDLNDYASYYLENLENINFFENTINWDNLPTNERQLTYTLGEGDQLVTSTNLGIANGSNFTNFLIGTQTAPSWRYVYIDNVPNGISSRLPQATLEMQETLLYTFKIQNMSIQEIMDNYTNIFNFMKYHYIGYSVYKNSVNQVLTNSNFIYTPPIDINAIYTNVSNHSNPLFYNSNTHRWEMMDNTTIYFTQSEIDEIFNS